MNNKQEKSLLVVVTGSTAVGKTKLCIDLALKYNTEILSCDSRQFYKEISIGTAKPTKSELEQVKHHFIGNLSVKKHYNVSEYEHDAIEKIEEIFKKKNIVFMTGGSGLYIDAVCNGIDSLPNPSPELRKKLKNKFEKEGLNSIQKQLKEIDPEYYNIVDVKNPSRILRALEVCIESGEKYSELRKNRKKERSFRVLKIVLNIERQELFQRINSRVDIMIKNGLLDEVKTVFPLKEYNALKTVGYRELFSYLENEIELKQAIENIKTNTRRYAKRQLTWLKKDSEYHWFSPNQKKEIIALINSY